MHQNNLFAGSPVGSDFDSPRAVDSPVSGSQVAEVDCHIRLFIQDNRVFQRLRIPELGRRRGEHLACGGFARHQHQAHRHSYQQAGSHRHHPPGRLELLREYANARKRLGGRCSTFVRNSTSSGAGGLPHRPEARRLFCFESTRRYRSCMSTFLLVYCGNELGEQNPQLRTSACHMFSDGRFAAVHCRGDGIVGDFLHGVHENSAGLVFRQTADGPKYGGILLGRGDGSGCAETAGSGISSGMATASSHLPRRSLRRSTSCAA